MKASVGPPLVERSSGFSGEYQTMGIVSQRPRFQTLLHLISPLVFQGIKHRRGWGDGAPLSTFRGKEKAGFTVLNLGKLLVNVDRAVVEVHGVPGETQQFRLAKTCEQGYRQKMLYIGAIRGGQQGGNLVIIEGVNLLLLLPGRLTPPSRIACYIVQRHGFLQGGLQYLVIVPHRGRGKTIKAVDKASAGFPSSW